MNGAWLQEIEADDEDKVPFTVERSSRELIEQRANEVQATLNLADGPLMRVVYFDLGQEANFRLLIAIHHLAVDGVSWRILIEDLQTAVEQQFRASAIDVCLWKTTSFQTWSEHLREYASVGDVESQLSYWTEQASADAALIRTDFEFSPEQNTCENAQIVECCLSIDETSALLHKASSAFHTQGDELLLAALALTFAHKDGRRSLLLDLEGHGREELPKASVDVSRTVGWFTTLSTSS